jgi:3-deoxy-manno-octulosonate cytidylyltransferase (CMP-KDO synthetase)
MGALIVIPARIGSTRFPGKPLAMIAGRSMIERVWRLAAAVKGADRVVIATDSDEIRAHAEKFGAEVVMTSPDCATGSDRANEAAAKLGPEYDIVFNFQGDSPLTPPWIVEAVLETMKAEPEVVLCTPIVKLEGERLAKFLEQKKAGSTTGTSCVFDRRGYAMYFSKGVIPHVREKTIDPPVYKHIGLYGYRRATLEKFSSLPEGAFEKVEKLEQLRALENGIPVRVVQVDLKGRTMASVDAPEDVAHVEAIIAREGELA